MHCNITLIINQYFSFFFLFAVFKLAGWPTRAIIARGTQWVPKDIVAISLLMSFGIPFILMLRAI